jgi:ABC-type branched-subunit amino acid transport system substrate-binding protein
MKIYRTPKYFYIFFLSVFILFFVKAPYASENNIPVQPAEIKASVATTLETEPSQISSSPDKIKRNSIGCILPLSGKYADFGNKALDAIMLAAGTSDKENIIPWEIIVEDSQGKPEKSKAIVENLANVKNVMVIIAISDSAEALELAKEANKWKVPIILITSKEKVTAEGEYVFQHFLTPTQQIRALVRYSVDDLNSAIFSVLHPQDEYGEELAKIFRKELTSVGGKVANIISYSKDQTDFANEISRLTGIDAISLSKRKKTAQHEKVPIDFDALFIPDSYPRIKMITSQLDYYKLKGFLLVGTSLWNSPNLLKNSAGYLEGAFFADSFFKDSSSLKTRKFVDSFFTVYKREPENIEAMAFDTSEMIFLVLDNANIKTRKDFAAGLSKIGIYNGATGIIYFNSDRVAQKTPFIIRIKDGKFEQAQ